MNSENSLPVKIQSRFSSIIRLKNRTTMSILSYHPDTGLLLLTGFRGTPNACFGDFSDSREVKW